MPGKEDQIKAAIQEVLNGRSIKSAAKRNNVVKTTLRNRLEGKPNRKEKYEALQLFTPLEESFLVHWALFQASLGYAPTHRMLRLYAQRMAWEKGLDHTIGKRWVLRFVKRHPSIRSVRAKAMDFRRLQCTSDEAVRAWFDRLRSPEIRKIPPRYRFNMDEIGTSMSLDEGTVVIGPAGCKTLMRNSPANREWATVLETISGVGRVLTPVVIFKGKHVQQQWYPEEEDEVNCPYEDWAFKASPKGWTCNEIALSWLKKVFLPQTVPNDPDQWRLLILDGHGSHIDELFMLAAMEAKVWLLYLPPHSSHILQPLDVGPFGVLKNRFKRELDLSCAAVNDSYVRKGDFLRAWAKARLTAFTEKVILSGWSATGIYPMDIKKPLNNRLRRSATLKAIDAAKQAENTRQPKEEGIAGFSTPKNSRQVKDLGSAILGAEVMGSDPTKRLLFSKVGKSVDGMTSRISQLEQEKAGLEAELEKTRAQKRRMVDEDPNEGFTADDAEGAEIDQNRSKGMKGSIKVRARRSGRKRR